MILDNNFDNDNNEEIEVIDTTEDEKTEKTEETDKGEKDSEYEDVCFICRRPESKTGKMFKLPNHISVCSDCMHKTMDTVSQFDYQGMLNNTTFNFDKNDNKEGKRRFPNISFVNIADLQGEVGFQTARNSRRKRQKRKKRKQYLTLMICQHHTESKRSWMTL